MTNTKTYWVEENDMAIVLDAINLLKENMANQKQFGLNSTSGYSLADIEALKAKYYAWPWAKESVDNCR